MSKLETFYLDHLSRRYGAAGAVDRGSSSAYRLLNARATLLRGQRALANCAGKTILAGSTPSRSFNACAIKTEFGYLVLVNEGLLSICLFASFLIAGFSRCTFRGKIFEPTYSPEEASGQWHLYVDRIKHGGDPGIHGDPTLLLRRLPAPREGYWTALYSSTIDFVIAHELAHIACGHLDKAVDASKPGWSCSWENELEADRVAVAAQAQAREADGLKVRSGIYGTLLFELFDYFRYGLTYYGRDVDGEEFPVITMSAANVDRHPHASLRRSAALSELAGLSPSSEWENVASVVQWFRILSGVEILGELEGGDSRDDRTLIERYGNPDDSLVRSVERLMQCGRAVNGVTWFPVKEILDWVAQDYERAKAAIGFVALAYLKHGKEAGHLFGIHLSILYVLFQVAFAKDADVGDDYKAFDDFLRRCVKDLTKLTTEYVETFMINVDDES